MRVLRVLAEGLVGVLAAPAPVILTWLTVLVFALPGAALMEEAIRADVGASRIHLELRRGLDLGWLEEFRERSGGLARALTPETVSSVAMFDNLERWFSGSWLTDQRQLAAWAGLFLLVWLLLQGGILDHLAAPRRRFAFTEFCASAGRYFFRFTRLAVLTGIAYFGVYRLGRWLFPQIERWTRDVTRESTALAAHLAGAVVIVLLLAFVHLVADYAKIATVVERRRSMLLAARRALAQVVRHPLQVYGLYGSMSMVLLGAQLLYFKWSPAPTRSGTIAVLLAVLVGQLYLLVRWLLRIALFSAELRLFEGWIRPSTVTGRRFG